MKVIERKEVKFDYKVEEASNDAAAAEYEYFKGTRGDLQDYLQLTNPQLYNKVAVYTVNGVTRDWFGALSSEFLYSALKRYGFYWENEKIRITLKDKKKEPTNDQPPQRYEVDWSQLDGLPERNVF